MIPVLICGGYGTKLWPLSREDRPKHFLSLISEKSLFQLNYEALLTHFKPQEIYISTNEDQKKMAMKQAPEVPEENYILEPEMRNQGPATGLIAAFLYKKGMEDEPFMIVQVDDIREPRENFIKAMLDSGEIAKKDKKYITGGMKTSYPVMGVDYLIKGKKVSEDESVGIYEVAEFVWRSTKEETIKLLENEGALIHINHTCMTPRNMLRMLEKYKQDWYKPLMNFVNGADLSSEYLKMPPGPLEDVTQTVHKNGESLVVEMPFKWSDFGTYDALHEYLKDNNMYDPGKSVIDLHGDDNFVKTEDKNKIVALVGVDNLVVVDTGDVILVCDKNHTSDVKEALNQAKERGLI